MSKAKKNHDNIDPHDAVDTMYRARIKYAQAKADRMYLELWIKSKKALLMASSPETAVNAQERDAMCHPEYLECLKGLREAVMTEESHKWELESAKARIEVWRTQQANMRAEGKATI